MPIASATRHFSDFTEVRQRFLRSIHLERDYQSADQNREYILTPTARHVLRRIFESLAEHSLSRAWSITGPYGVGKSAFAVFLSKLLCPTLPGREDALQVLAKSDSPLAAATAEKVIGKGFLPVAITARRAPAALCLVEGILPSARALEGSAAISLSGECEAALQDSRQGKSIDARRIVRSIRHLASAAIENGFQGLLLLIDELGKIFEYAARMPQKSDLFVLQELAEQSSRSGNVPFLLIGFLHQSFEEYGLHLDNLTRKEWAKIHGRFEDIAFLEPPEQVMRMVAAAIFRAEPLPAGLRAKIRNIAGCCAENGFCPAGIQPEEWQELCERSYPLHPATLAALPFLFRRFAQNERSLFSYLGSLEPGGFQDFLHSQPWETQETVFLRLNRIFDYFTLNFGSGLFRQPQAKRWMEAADVLDRQDNLHAAHVDLIKTIGVLGSLGDFSPLSPTLSMISLSLYDTARFSEELLLAIRFLEEQSIVTHRRFNQTYRIWEGSDVDIEERIAEGKRQLRGSISLADHLQRYLPARPMTARRHSFQTGSWRYFQLNYVEDPETILKGLVPMTGAAGIVVICLSSSSAMLQDFLNAAKATPPDRPELLFALPQQMGEIQTGVEELAALRWAWDNTPELQGDRVARREISLRLSEWENNLRNMVETLLDPREEPEGSECLWFWKGERQAVKSRVDVSQLLSRICDQIYVLTPRVRNELVVRRALSSAAAAARRNLMEAMLTRSEQRNLGFNGYPPERSIYESVLKNTGIHRQVAPEHWGFSDPPAESGPNIYPVWDFLRQEIFASAGTPLPVSQLFGKLAAPPYGVLEGMQPILLCAFMAANAEETTLYREGTFLPEPGIADFEVLMRRPELYAVGGCRLDGIKKAIVERLAKGLGTQPAIVPVVRALFRMVKGLPEFAWNTQRLSEKTIRLREAFTKAKAPDQFLFSDLPTGLGYKPFFGSGTETEMIPIFFSTLNEGLKEWADVALITYGNAKNQLLHACGLDTDENGWQRLREIATRLEPRESDPAMLSFLRRVIQAERNQEGVLSVLAMVASRPTANWQDTDVERFPRLALTLGESIQRTEFRADPKNRLLAHTARLTLQEQEQAHNLVGKLKQKLQDFPTGQNPIIMQAALLLLAEELTEESKD